MVDMTAHESQVLEGVVAGQAQLVESHNKLREEVHVYMARTDATFKALKELCDLRHGQLTELPLEVAKAQGGVTTLKTIAPWLLTVASVIVTIVLSLLHI